jgi:hypothetical protein
MELAAEWTLKVGELDHGNRRLHTADRVPHQIVETNPRVLCWSRRSWLGDEALEERLDLMEFIHDFGIYRRST